MSDASSLNAGGGGEESLLRKKVKIALVVLAYFTVSILLVFSNKVLLSNDGAMIPAPLFVTWSQRTRARDANDALGSEAALQGSTAAAHGALTIVLYCVSAVCSLQCPLLLIFRFQCVLTALIIWGLGVVAQGAQADSFMRELPNKKPGWKLRQWRPACTARCAHAIDLFTS